MALLTCEIKYSGEHQVKSGAQVTTGQKSDGQQVILKAGALLTHRQLAVDSPGSPVDDSSTQTLHSSSLIWSIRFVGVHHLHRHTLPDQGGGAVPQPGDVDGVVSDESADGRGAAFLAAQCEVRVAGEEGVCECLNHTMSSILCQVKLKLEVHLHRILRIVFTGN